MENTRYIDVRNTNLGLFGTARYHDTISMKAKAVDSRQDGKRVFIPVDDAEAACFQVGDNYGNCFYMSRQSGNTLFKALKNDKTFRILCGWELHKAIAAFLKANNITYTVACSRP